jgi:hypothetical protein
MAKTKTVPLRVRLNSPKVDGPSEKYSKTGTRSTFGKGVVPSRPPIIIDATSADQIVDQYIAAIPSNHHRRNIAKHLIGKPRTSGAARPNAPLFASRFGDIYDKSHEIEQLYGDDDEMERNRAYKDAADTMLAGGAGSPKRCPNGFRKNKEGICKKHSSKLKQLE